MLQALDLPFDLRGADLLALEIIEAADLVAHEKVPCPSPANAKEMHVIAGQQHL